MKPRNRMMSGLFVIALAALLMSPSAAAEPCTQECTQANLSGCAQGAATGAASGGQAGFACMGYMQVIINIAITLGPVHQCSNEFYSAANSCSGEDGGPEFEIPRLR